MDMQWRRGSVWWMPARKIYSKKIQIKNPSQSRPGGRRLRSYAPGPPPPPPPPPSPSPVERIELPHGPGGRSGWSRLVGRPAGSRPGRARPADIKLGPCKRDKGKYWC